MPYKYPRVCPICHKPNVGNLACHLRNKHGLSASERRDILPLALISKNHQQSDPHRPFELKQPLTQQQPFLLRHPYTMSISGPTSSGKTTLVKNLLQSNHEKIHPPPQRILWLYKRWQPLYDVIKSTVTPSVEFIQGIPLHLERDDFIDPQVRNLIVIDDLMSTATKDSRITDLFTEGSHHRNLSVICLNQNLYYGKDATQRRNCHYIALFNNPVDKLQVMALARQMYPGNSQHFMRHYDEAIGKPYGYLLVDLKPDTREHLRLRPNVFDPKSIRGSDTTLHQEPDTQEHLRLTPSIRGSNTTITQEPDTQEHLRLTPSIRACDTTITPDITSIRGGDTTIKQATDITSIKGGDSTITPEQIPSQHPAYTSSVKSIRAGDTLITQAPAIKSISDSDYPRFNSAYCPPGLRFCHPVRMETAQWSSLESSQSDEASSPPPKNHRYHPYRKPKLSEVKELPEFWQDIIHTTLKEEF